MGKKIDEQTGIEFNEHTSNIWFQDSIMKKNNNEKWTLRKWTGSPYDFDVYFDDYHKFSCEWTPNYISFYFDDKLIRTSYTEYAKRLIPMNLIIGIGTPHKDFFIDGFVENSLFPYWMDIDYVRVYKLVMDCEEDVSAAQFNWNTHDYKVKRNITVNKPVLAGQSVALRATESITLLDGFEVPMGSSFYANNCDCE